MNRKKKKKKKKKKISPYSVRMRENADQISSKYAPFYAVQMNVKIGKFVLNITLKTINNPCSQ